MTKSREIDRLLAEESAEWTERLRHGDRRTRAEFATWSRKSPLHMRHFLMMVALDHELERIDPDKRIPLPPRAARESAEVVELPAAHTAATAEAKPARRRMLGWWALAASMLLGVSALLYAPQFIYRAQGWTEYSTALGEQRAVELPDGSIAHLNTNSEILVRLSETERQVRLLSGEALFKVHHDTTRPFRVYTDDATIQAVGTQFNVYRQAEGTRVSVLEGRVKVTAEESAKAPSATESTGSPGSVGSASPMAGPRAEKPSIKLLTVGETAEVRQDGTITKTEVVDVSAMASWRQRRLVFKQDALATVITEFNRYNQTPQFRLVGADVASRRYSGAFDADDPESLIALLSIDKDLQIQRNGGEIIIRARNPAIGFAQSP